MASIVSSSESATPCNLRTRLVLAMVAGKLIPNQAEATLIENNGHCWIEQNLKWAVAVVNGLYW